jgi:hypothetical protein
VRVLYDRLYYAQGSAVTDVPPPVPFDVADIGFAPERSARMPSAGPQAAAARPTQDDALMSAFGSGACRLGPRRGSAV